MSGDRTWWLLQHAEHALRRWIGHGRAGGATVAELLATDGWGGKLNASGEALENALRRAVKTGQFQRSPDGRYWHGAWEAGLVGWSHLGAHRLGAGTTGWHQRQIRRRFPIDRGVYSDCGNGQVSK